MNFLKRKKLQNLPKVMNDINMVIMVDIHPVPGLG